jgi:hypothetical protein
MSSVLDLESQLAFGDVEGLRWWFKTHADQHAAYVTKLQANYRVTPPSVDLLDQRALTDWLAAMAEGRQGKITPQLGGWLLDHERLHQAELAALGGPTELGISTVDFRDPEQFYGWMLDHIQLHDAEDPLLL